MKYTLEALINEDPKILGYYRNARERWKQILKEVELKNTNALALRLQDEQGWFEHNCGGKNLGKEVMVFTGIGQFYSTTVGFEPAFDEDESVDRKGSALAVLKAFQRKGLYTMETQEAVIKAQQLYKLT
jgi:hypothetical protein